MPSFTVPAYTISNIDIELRFAVVEPTEEPSGGEEVDIKVRISPDSLTGLEAHHISMAKLKITPVTMRVFEEERQ